jgi:hypothetical protein
MFRFQDDQGQAETVGRRRIALDVVDSSDATGLVVPHRRDGSIAYRGHGPADYACGCCGRLLAIGVMPGMFQSLAFSCGCGALNQVPGRASPLRKSA